MVEQVITTTMWLGVASSLGGNRDNDNNNNGKNEGKGASSDHGGNNG